MSQAQQPEALRLADALAYCDSSVAAQAARELRTQHARIAELAAMPGAEKLRAALKEAIGVIGSINCGPGARITVGDDTCYWQRDEWVVWALKEVLPSLKEALQSPARHAEGVSAPATLHEPSLTDEQIEQAYISARDEFMLSEVERRTDKQLRLAFGRAVLKASIVATPATPSDSESVLIEGVAYKVPAAVAAELLSLHLELLEAATPAAGVPFNQWWTEGGHQLVAKKALDNGWRGAAEAGFAGGLAQAAGVPAAAPDAPTEQDSICAWKVWWTHDKAKHTTTRQAALAAWNAAVAYAVSRSAQAARAPAAVPGAREAVLTALYAHKMAIHCDADGDPAALVDFLGLDDVRPGVARDEIEAMATAIAGAIAARAAQGGAA